VRFKIFVIVTSACALLSQSVAVYAHDHRPPKVVLTSGGTTQRGELGTFCWWRIDTSSGESRLHCVDALYGWPKARTVRSGARARIHIAKAQAPKQLRLSAWRRVGSLGYPKGARDRLRPVSADGEIVAYDAVFRLPAKAGPHYFVSAYGRWTDEEATAEDQDAQWAFHLRLKERSRAR
jgi:hypothetical protein